MYCCLYTKTQVILRQTRAMQATMHIAKKFSRHLLLAIIQLYNFSSRVQGRNLQQKSTAYIRFDGMGNGLRFLPVPGHELSGTFFNPFYIFK